MFSTGFNRIRQDPLHVQVPLYDIPRNVWVCLVADVRELSGPEPFTIEQMTVSPSCQLKRIMQCSIKCVRGASGCLPLHLGFNSITPFEEFCVRNIQPAPPVVATLTKPSAPVKKRNPVTRVTPKDESLARELTPPTKSCSEAAISIIKSKSILDEAYSFIRGAREASSLLKQSNTPALGMLPLEIPALPIGLCEIGHDDEHVDHESIERAFKNASAPEYSLDDFEAAVDIDSSVSGHQSQHDPAQCLQSIVPTVTELTEENVGESSSVRERIITAYDELRFRLISGDSRSDSNKENLCN